MATKKYVVQYDIGGALYYEVEANSPKQAVAITDDWFAEYRPNIYVREAVPADEDKDYDELNDNWERVY